MATPANNSKTDKFTTILGAIAGVSAMVAASGLLDPKHSAYASLLSGLATMALGYFSKGITALPTPPAYPPQTHIDLQSGQPR